MQISEIMPKTQCSLTELYQQEVIIRLKRFLKHPY